MKKTRLSSPKFSKRMLALIVGLVAITGAVFIWRIFAASSLLYTQPAAATVPPGQAVNVAVRMDSGTDGVNVVQLKLSYPADKLRFDGFDNTGTAFGNDVGSQGNAGVIDVSRYTPVGTAAVSGDKLITTLKFTVLAGSSGSANVNYSGNQFVVRASDNANLYTAGNHAGSIITIQSPASPPTISIATPSSSYTAPADITLNPTISVDPSRQISKVDYFNGSSLIGTVSSASNPSSYSFIWKAVPAGGYTVSARVTDSANATATSNNLSVTVGQTPSKPSVTIQTNGTNFLVGDTITLTSTVTPFTGRTVADFKFLNGTATLRQFTTNQATYTHSFVATAASTYNFSATATDNGQPALTGNSSVIQVTVGNPPPPPPPPPPTNLQVTGKTQSSVSLSWTAPAGVAVNRYIVTRNGQDLGSTITSTSFTDTNLTASTSYTYTVKAVNNNGTSSASNQVQTSTDPKPKLTGDINDDHVVNNSDFVILISRWGTNDTAADLNGNGKVDGFDFVILFKNFGKSN